MNELLLQQLYGTDDVETVKQAQAELVQQVALEAGIDINALSDEDLAKFAHYVLSDGEVAPEGTTEGTAQVAAPTAEATADSEKIAADKIAEADYMGRLMARAYLDEQMKIASAVETGDWTGLEDVAEALLANEVQTKVASATNAIAADWAALKEASFAGAVGKVKDVAIAGVNRTKDGVANLRTGVAMRKADPAKAKELLVTGAKQVAPAALAGGALVAGGTAAAMSGSKKQASLEKEAAVQFVEGLEPIEFAKLAEARAAEILAANGIHPETFEEIEPTAIKIAEFPTPEDCQSWDSKLAMKAYNDKLNESALTILESLGFSK